jgi:hypothetical protein
MPKASYCSFLVINEGLPLLLLMMEVLESTSNIGWLVKARVQNNKQSRNKHITIYHNYNVKLYLFLVTFLT